MAKLPTRDDLSAAPSARSGRPIATFDTTAIGRGQEAAGRAIQGAAADIAGIAKQQEAIDDYDAELKFQQFKWDEELGLEDAQTKVEPGQAGRFAEDWVGGYGERAKGFLAPLPEATRRKYDLKLKLAEKELFRKAATFGRTEQKRHAETQQDDFVNGALPSVTNPQAYSKLLGTYERMVDDSPWMTPIEKDQVKRAKLPKIEAAYVKGLADRATRLEDLGQLDRDLGFGLEAGTPEEQASKGVTGADPQQARSGPTSFADFARGKGKWEPAEPSDKTSVGGDNPGAYKAADLDIVYKLAPDAPYGKSATRNAQDFKGIVLHHTGGEGADRFIKYGHSVDEKRGGSFGYHFYVDRDGTVFQGAPMDRRTNHVKPGGAPQRKDGTGLANENAIGIALLGSGGDETPEQLEAVKRLGVSLQQTYGIDGRNIVGHGDLQTDREGREGRAAVAAIRGEAPAPGAKLPSTPDTYAGPYRHLTPEQRLELSHYARTRANALAKALEEERKQAALRERANDILGGRMPADPGSKIDRGIIDEAFEATDIQDRLNAADPQAAGQVTAFVKHTGYVPEMAVSELRAMSVNGSDEQKVYALETAANLLREKPGALEGSEKSKALKDDASLYEALTMDAGIDANEALARIQEMRTPEFAKRREAFKAERDVLLRDVKADDLTAEFGGLFTSTPALGGTPSQGGVVLDAYRELVGNHYVKTGDIDIAKAMAKKDLQRTYAVSDITGNKRFMRHPPEKYYPALESAPGETPSRKYFSDQLQASVNEYVGRAGQVFGQVNPEARAAAMTAQAVKLPEIPLSDIFIEPVPQTNSDIRAGRYPGYAVSWIERRDGIPVLTTAPGFVFRADVKGAQQNANTLQQARVRELRQEMLDRERRYDEAPLRPIGKPIEEIFRGERQLPTETGAAERLRGGNVGFFERQQAMPGARLPDLDEETP